MNAPSREAAFRLDSMKAPFMIILLLASTLGFCLLGIGVRNAKLEADSQSITLYCAAGLRLPVSEIVAQYQEETGHSVKVIYNGSGALLSQMKIGGGDLYLPAHSAYVDDARALGLADGLFPIAELTAKVVVHRDCDEVASFADLAKPEIKISFADESAAIGSFAKHLLEESGEFRLIEQNITVTKPTVNSVLEDVSLGSVNATIAWDAVAQSFSELRTIPHPLFEKNKGTVAFTMLKSSKEHEVAQAFASYLVDEDKGMAVLERHGFVTVDPVNLPWVE